MIMVALFVVALFANIGMGAVEIPPAQALSILLSHIGLDVGAQFDARTDAIFWNIRLPRVALGILVGGSLGIAGAALQGVFRNPLAEPGIIGVSSGAAAGAVGAIVLGFSAFNVHGVAVAAFLCGLLATTVVYTVAKVYGQTAVTTLILAGIAVNATAGALQACSYSSRMTTSCAASRSGRSAMWGERRGPSSSRSSPSSS